jgi:hypothetical protein
MHNRLVSPIGPIVRSHCALCLASATDRRRPSGMGIAVYTAAASNMPPRRPASPTRSRLSQLRWSFVTCDQAHFAGKVLVESCFSQHGNHPHLGNPTADDDVASRDGPSLRRSSLTARVERQVRHSEAARTCELEANHLKRSRLGSQDQG